ncbi:energy transducer TonB [Acidipila sp. EB88]|uniref:energy transducer TonB n=1 Tax=Acidipila sp. EB88 TaxID=2305226 RepID=UPI0013157BEE|nr:energy transducer TonB [Acidipila sp. EB88]
MAQAPPHDWNRQLVGQPLYLRGFWLTDQLQFDSAGNALNKPTLGPVTLSGIDVTGTELKSGKLVIHGNRVGLVQNSDAQPGLHRQALSTVTQIMFSMRRSNNRNYSAPEVIALTIQPDAAGTFDQAIAHIFVNGLTDLAAVVPVYWQCYAESYFKPATIAPDAEDKVKQCVVTDAVTATNTKDAAAASEVGSEAPQSLDSAPLHLELSSQQAIAHGTATIHLRIREDGTPVGLQVVRAVGAGIDESLMQALAQTRYKPATRDGEAVPYNLNLDYHFNEPSH